MYTFRSIEEAEAAYTRWYNLPQGKKFDIICKQNNVKDVFVRERNSNGEWKAVHQSEYNAYLLDKETKIGFPYWFCARGGQMMHIGWMNGSPLYAYIGSDENAHIDIDTTENYE